MTYIDENIIEIAWVDQLLQADNKYRDDIDSMDEKIEILKLAREFENKYKERDWNMKGDYYEAIYKFAEDRLLAVFGKES